MQLCASSTIVLGKYLPGTAPAQHLGHGHALAILCREQREQPGSRANLLSLLAEPIIVFPSPLGTP